jgi:CAAX prenyl protease-like protein
VSPQLLFGQPPRTDGYNPTLLDYNPALYWCSVSARFLRLVVVVPLIEEIFWRGFLQRYLIDERFTTVPIGKYTAFSFWCVVFAFASVHWGPNWMPGQDFWLAVPTGAIYGWLLIRTKSLFAPIVAHAVTNLALGLYIMKTGQWGFW